MTPAEFVVCVTALGALIGERNPAYDPQWRTAIARNVCAAANSSGVDVRALAAIALNESGNFDLHLSLPAARGRDLGAFQINSHFQAHRQQTSLAHHPYFGASVAAAILRENVARYGLSWKAIAAYWSPAQAERGTVEARRYYQRWEAHYRIVDRHFEAARRLQRQVAAELPVDALAQLKP